MGIKKFLFNNTNTRQTVLKNTIWIGASTTLVKVIRAGIVIYAARLLGTESYGVFTYAMSIAAIFSVVSDIGLSNIITRELSKKAENLKEYFATSLIIKIGFLIAMMFLVLGIGPLLSRFDSSTALLPIIGVSIVLESLRTFLYAIPRANNKMQTEAGISVANELFCTTFILLLFLRNPSAETLALSFLFGNALGLLIGILSVWKNIFNKTFRFSKALVLPILKLTFPFAILGVFGIFMTNIDALIIGIYGNEHLLGLYGAAQRPIGVLYVLPNFIGISLLPILSRFLSDTEKKDIGVMMSLSAKASLTIALPIVLGGIVVAGPLMSVLFGNAYTGAVLTFQILLVTLLFMFPGTLFADVLLVENRQRFFVTTSIIGACINVALDIILIPRFGIAGSAVATVFAQIVLNTLYYFSVKKRHTIALSQGMYKSILASILMAIGAYLLMSYSIPLIVIVILSGIFYLSLLILMKDRTVLELKKSLT